MNRSAAVLACAAVLALPAPLSARESLGMFGNWGAFSDPSGPRCYAIALAEKAKGPTPYQAFASVGTWPRRNVRGQVYVRTSQPLAKGAAISLSIGGKAFALSGSGADAWARDRQSDAAIVAALRSAKSFSVRAVSATGRGFTDRYALDGVASALDAATVGCARLR